MTDKRDIKVGFSVSLTDDKSLILLRDNTPVAVWTNGTDYAIHKVADDWVMCYGAWRYRKVGRYATRTA